MFFFHKVNRSGQKKYNYRYFKEIGVKRFQTLKCIILSVLSDSLIETIFFFFFAIYSFFRKKI